MQNNMQDNMVGQNIIITEGISALRQLGRNALRGKWKTSIVAICIMLLCIYVPTEILNNFMGMNLFNLLPQTGAIDPEAYSQYGNSMQQYNILSLIYLICITGAFSLGSNLFFLASFRGHHVVPKDIFLGFERFFKSMGLFLFMVLFVILWSLPFFVVACLIGGMLMGVASSMQMIAAISGLILLAYIPGIIAAIRYSQAFFILADDPSKTIRQCVRESKIMMKGNKAKYFKLYVSFIGWLILSVIPVYMLTSATERMTDSTTAIIVATIVSALFYAPVMAYMKSTFAGFYEILAGHLIKETAPAPITPDRIDVEAPLAHIEEVIESVEETEQEPRIDVDDIMKKIDDDDLNNN